MATNFAVAVGGLVRRLMVISRLCIRAISTLNRPRTSRASRRGFLAVGAVQRHVPEIVRLDGRHGLVQRVRHRFPIGHDEMLDGQPASVARPTPSMAQNFPRPVCTSRTANTASAAMPITTGTARDFDENGHLYFFFGNSGPP